MDPSIIQLSGLSVAEVALLTTAGITNTEEFMGMPHEDVSEALPQASIATKRKLFKIAQYLALGHNIVANTTTMVEIHRYFGEKAYPPAPIQLPPQPPAEQDPTRGAPRMSINGLEDFDGTATEWLKWESLVKATIGQSVYAEYLDNPPDQDNVSQKTRKKEFYNMLAKATNNGFANHLIAKNKDDGHEAWVALQAW
jgi:hypothetical protein